MRSPLAVASLLLSGSASLLAQTVLQKYMQVVFGGMNVIIMYAVSFAFVAGFGLGALTSARLLARRSAPLWLLWLCCELACAVGVTAFVPIFERLHATLGGGLMTVFGQDPSLYYLYVVGLIAVTAFVLAIVMGLNYPVAFETVQQQLRLQPSAAAILVLASNTIGAAAGSLTAVHLMPSKDLASLLWLSAALYVGAGILVVRFRMPPPSVIGAPSLSAPKEDLLGFKTACAILFLSGFAGFSYEGLLFRHFSILDPTRYDVFGRVLAYYLVAWGVGASLAQLLRLEVRVVLLLAAVSFSLSWDLFAEGLAVYLSIFSPPSVFLMLKAFAPALFSGWLFASVHKHVPRLDSLRLAVLYVASLCGTFVGGWTVGYALPAMGVGAVYVIALAALLLAFGCLFLARRLVGAPSRRRWESPMLYRPLALVAFGYIGIRIVVPLCAATSPNDHYMFGIARFKSREPVPASTFEFRESWAGVVWTARNSLFVNGLAQTPDYDNPYYSPLRYLQFVLPMILRQRQKIFIIGIGMGVSNGKIAALNPLSTVISSDYSPPLYYFLEKYRRYNADLLFQPNSVVKLSDGRLELMLTKEVFDLIVEAGNGDAKAGTSALKSYEFLRLARARLTPNGVYIAHSSKACSARAMGRVFRYVYWLREAEILIGADIPLDSLFDEDSARRLLASDTRLAHAVTADNARSFVLRRLPELPGRYTSDLDPCSDYSSTEPIQDSESPDDIRLPL